MGGSFALEYSIRGAYEQTIGRLSEWTSSHELVEEDAYAARVAREYADFVYIRPFYEFHFAHTLKELWKETPLRGKHPIRKWERKFILSVDYGFEALYQEFPRIKTVREVSAHSYVVIIPRYQEFTDFAEKIAKRDVHFAQIAGNDEIMLTIVAPNKWSCDLAVTDGTLLFTENFLTQPDLERIALECPVRSLHAVLNTLVSRGAKIEHIYDY